MRRLRAGVVIFALELEPKYWSRSLTGDVKRLDSQSDARLMDEEMIVGR